MSKFLRYHMRLFRHQNLENNAKKPDSNPGLRPNILKIFVAPILQVYIFVWDKKHAVTAVLLHSLQFPIQDHPPRLY